MTYDNSVEGGKCKVVDESMADQKASLHDIPATVANHKQHPVDRDAIQPVGSKAMQGGKFD